MALIDFKVLFPREARPQARHAIFTRMTHRILPIARADCFVLVEFEFISFKQTIAGGIKNRHRRQYNMSIVYQQIKNEDTEPIRFTGF